MSIQIEMWHLVLLALSVLSGFWALVKIIAAQHERSLDKRFSVLANTIQKEQETTRQLERDLMNLKSDLPLHYVRREDYIRGQSVVEAKLDRLASMVQYSQLQATQNAALKNPL